MGIARIGTVHVSCVFMSMESDDQLGAGLVYEDLVPMRWRKVDNIQAAQLVRMNEANEEILRFISVLDDYHAESAGEARGSSTGDINRIEYKLNLLLDLVSQILVHHVELPPVIPIKMSANGVQWLSKERLQPGQIIFLDIYFYHNYPRPIVLAGKVQNVNEAGGAYDTEVSFEHMSDVVRRWLDKLIFRQHRRGVALSRRQSLDDDPDTAAE